MRNKASAMSIRAVVGVIFLLGVGRLFPNTAEAQVEFLSQNWDADQRQTFYTTSQGSRIMPYDWFLALETSEGQDSFVRDLLPKLGYLPNDNTTDNPDRLPVGFVADIDASRRKHIGLTCAACHTNQIAYQGKTFQIDGAPTLADMWGMLEGIDNSLTATREQPDKFDRFATAVLGEAADDAAAVATLKSELDEFYAYWHQFIHDSRVPHPWGRARLDAFGMIFNRVTSIDLGIPDNSRPPDAPVSYPFLWGTSFEDVVQWNGSAENTNDIERLGRNLGEVLGVFGQAEFRGPGFLQLPSFRTSAKRLNQLKLENQLKELWSPQWPDHLGEIDPEKHAAGKILFEKNCIRCHKVIPHGMQHTPVTVKMTPLTVVGTDPKMAVNAATGTVATGDLRRLIGFRAKMPRGELLQKLVRLSLISPFRDVRQNRHLLLSLPNETFSPTEIKKFLLELGLTEDDAMRLLAAHHDKLKDYYKDLRQASRMLATDSIPSAEEDVPQSLRYKARPLDGIWATAPYLHNGSVPNLYELLLPAEQRSATFYVGSNQFDPEKVGFETQQGEGTTFFDTSLPGNSNAGHDTYGTFNEEQRWQLVEYMKSL
ncbi:di-heme-cytochrome C peroxidase [Roseimaritima ulvae]|uniref:Cytochrome c n=1 Tax=Roseimaritima ulvae TaxID=980254 RepID=A0A5B9QVR4_9BACT|nr:di-heme-cytochrome C peroxidase [Roseimaritima ulvae]QEG41989.1 Cytochrome c [Roseimaritima ulvae]